jgi:K+-transporting ATPase ATPase A chain
VTLLGWLNFAILLGLVLALTKPLGIFMTRVFARDRTWLDPLLRPVERLIYRLTGVDETREMRWPEYAAAVLVFSFVTLVVTYVQQRVQAWLPGQALFNPQGLGAPDPHSAFNTAASFTTNTNWQSYVPETTMTYLTQMAGLAYHNFLSAAAGLAIAIAVIRGIANREKDTLGNFWVDLTRGTLWVLLPACLIGALVLVQQGVPQNLRPYDHATIVDPIPASTGSDGKPVPAVTEQIIAQGPVASQEIIKELGTNGGGFFNANSAHPFENPTPLANMIEIFLILAISAGLTYTLGMMTGTRRHGWAVLAAMFALLLIGLTVVYWAEARGNPIMPASVSQIAGDTQAGGNMEGKECRFGIAGSVLFATATTGTSCGAVNSMHDSYTPLGGLVPLVNIQLGEVIFGGVGSGLYGMFIFVVLAVFIAGLMVGRTPEYLGKKIDAFDVKMAMLATLVFPLIVLDFSAAASVTGVGTAAIANPGPHGLSEMLYAFTSGTGNNGSAFAGISANTPWYNTMIGIAMLIGRFMVIVPTLALAGNLGRKKITPPSLGTFPVTTPLFTALLCSVILIVGALTFFPVLSLGPVVEHLLMTAGKTF